MDSDYGMDFDHGCDRSTWSACQTGTMTTWVSWACHMASVLAGCKPVAGHSLQFAFAMHYALSLVHLNVLYLLFHIPGHVTTWLAHEAKLLSLQRCPQRSSKPRRCEEPLQKGCRILASVMSFMSHVNACHAGTCCRVVNEGCRCYVLFIAKIHGLRIVKNAWHVLNVLTILQTMRTLNYLLWLY